MQECDFINVFLARHVSGI